MKKFLSLILQTLITTNNAESQESPVIDEFTSTNASSPGAGALADQCWGNTPVEAPEALKWLENSGTRFIGVPFVNMPSNKIVKDRSIYFSVDTVVTTQLILESFDAAGIDIDSITSVQRKSSNNS